MAGDIIKIVELPLTDTIAGSDFFPVSQGGETYKIPYRVFQNDAITRAEESAERAEESAEQAEAAAVTVSDLTSQAILAAQSASASETYAESCANAAEGAKEAAEQAEENASDYSVASKSWAVGGTNTREFEEYDNSKYYSELSRQGANRAGWVDFYIDSDGYLHYRKTPNTELEFYIHNGYLHVILGA